MWMFTRGALVKDLVLTRWGRCWASVQWEKQLRAHGGAHVWRRITDNKSQAEADPTTQYPVKRWISKSWNAAGCCRIAKVLVLLSQRQTTADVHSAMSWSCRTKFVDVSIILTSDCTAARCFFVTVGACPRCHRRKSEEVKPTTQALPTRQNEYESANANQRSFIRAGKTLLQQCGNSCERILGKKMDKDDTVWLDPCYRALTHFSSAKLRSWSVHGGDTMPSVTPLAVLLCASKRLKIACLQSGCFEAVP